MADTDDRKQGADADDFIPEYASVHMRVAAPPPERVSVRKLEGAPAPPSSRRPGAPPPASSPAPGSTDSTLTDATDTPPVAPPDDPGAVSSEGAERASAHAIRKEGTVAFFNALKLAASLSLTWSVALIVTFKLPRYLGPLKYGYYSFAESFAATLFVFIGLGVDTYVQREVPVRPKHASDFFLGFTLARLVLSLPLFLAGALILHAKPAEVQAAAFLFGVVQIFTTMNETFAKMLQASTNVGGLAVSNVVAKILWGGGAFLLVTLEVPLAYLVLPMLAAEALKACFLYAAARRAIGLELKLDLGVTRAVIRESFPFFASAIAVTLGQKLDVTMLEFINPGEEVGYYGSARQIATLSAFLAPIVSGVLIPMMRRAHERNEEDFYAILRRCLEGVVVVAVPVTLLFALGADYFIALALRKDFAPGASSMQYLAPTFVLSYGNVLLWVALMILKRSWTISIVSIGGLVALPILILAFVPLTRGLGPGGAGMGAALAVSVRELGVLLIFLYYLGRKATDRRSIASIAATLAIAAAVFAMHRFLLGSAHPLVLLAIDGVVFLVLGLVARVYRVGEMLSVLKLIKNRGR